MAGKRKNRTNQVNDFGTRPTSVGTKTEMIRALTWYNYTYDRKALVAAMNTNYPKTNGGDDSKISTTQLTILMMIADGIKVSSDTLAKVTKSVDDVAATAVTKVRAEKAQTVNKVTTVIAELEEQIDVFASKKKKNDFAPFPFLKSQGLTGPQLKAIQNKYSPLLEELILVIKGNDADLTEAYRHMSLASVRRFRDFVNQIISDCGLLIGEKKLTRKPRKVSTRKKTVDVSKDAKPCESIPEYNIVSLNPRSLVGAKMAYLYLVQSNMVVQVHAADESGLTFSRSKLIGFDPKKSVKRRIRRDNRRLSIFVGQNKLSMARMFGKFSGKAESVIRNGIKINNGVVILKSFK